MAKLSVFNPVALSQRARVDPAPRVTDLNGKRVGLYWNMKAGGDAALQRVEELLGQRYPHARFARYQGDMGFMVRHLTPSEAARIALECDVTVGTTGD